MLPKGDRLAQWDLRQTSDTTPARPLYSGHLLKLGSNDRWQSRLFTFDGSVLICVGKRPRAPVIMTYDPYVSSPFMSPSCNPHPMNPNTKWFINITSVTDIKLLPSSRSFRCFPYSDSSRALSIHTNDGRHLVLRANKDTELERWYFVLFKIWEFQQQLKKAEEQLPQQPQQPQTPTQTLPQARTPTQTQTQTQTQAQAQAQTQTQTQTQTQAQAQTQAQPSQIQPLPSPQGNSTSQLAAHQQSAQLFQKYLQKQYHQPKDQHDHEFSSLPPTTTQTQHVQILQPPKMLRPPLNRPRESFIRYQLPAPARVSAFLPQGFDWSQQKGEEDDLPVRLSSYDSPPLAECHPLTRHASHSHPAVSSMGHRELSRSASAGMVPQRFGVPAASSMEPSKAAIIDHWRRSLMSPLLLEEPTGPRGQETPEGTKGANEEGDDDDEPLLPEHPRADNRDIESASRHESHEFEDGLDSKRVSKRHTENNLRHNSDDAPAATNLYSRPHGRERSYIGNQRSSFLPGMAVKEEVEEEAPMAVNLGEALDTTVQQLAVSDCTKERGEEDELPLGLLHVNRHSRWLNTQLSSEDGASAINHDSLIDGRPASEPILETKSRATEEVHHSDPDLDLDRLTPPHSNPSLSLHGSSYSHLPIHDPEFVFPHTAFDPSVTLVNTPTSLQFEITNSPSIPPPMRQRRPNLSVDLTAFSSSTLSAATVSPHKGHTSPGMAMLKNKEDPSPRRPFSSSNISIHPHASMPGFKYIRPMGDKINSNHQRTDGDDDDDDDDDEEPLVHTLSRQQSQRKHTMQMHIQVPPLNNNMSHHPNQGYAKEGHGYTLREQTTPPASDESFQYF